MSRGLTFEFEDVVAEWDDRVRLDTTSVPTKSPLRRVWRARRAAELMLDPRRGSGGDELVFAVA